MQKTHEGLPEYCFAYGPAYGLSEEVVVIKRGEQGYYKYHKWTIAGGRTPEELNARLGVTPAQVEAMFVGSMFGWDVPGANPAAYDAEGRLRKES